MGASRRRPAPSSARTLPGSRSSRSRSLLVRGGWPMTLAIGRPHWVAKMPFAGPISLAIGMLPNVCETDESAARNNCHPCHRQKRTTISSRLARGVPARYVEPISVSERIWSNSIPSVRSAVQHAALLMVVALSACTSQSTEFSPGCIAANGQGCPYPSGTLCPGPPEVCVECATGVYLQSTSDCTCTSGTWRCAPPPDGSIQCSNPTVNAGYYVDPMCSVAFPGDGGGAVLDGSATQADATMDGI